MSEKKIAAIDLGSNSFLLTIAEKNESSLRVEHDECIVTGIAKKLSPEGFVSSEAMEKAIRSLQKFRAEIEKHKVNQVIAVATESLRRPRDGEKVKIQLEKQLGYPIQIISPEREAELSFWSVEKDPLAASGHKIVFDIGGSSTELILGNRDGIQQLCSLKLGSVVLTEKFQLDRPTNYQAALEYCLEVISNNPIQKGIAAQGIGVAGTMTTLLAVLKKIKDYKREKVHGETLTQSELLKCIEKIFQLSLEDRKQIPGLQPERADVFGGGMLIVLALMQYFSWPSVTCFDTGVRYGILYEHYNL